MDDDNGLPPAIRVSMAVSKLASHHQRNREQLFGSIEGLLVPLDIDNEDYKRTRELYMVPLIVLVHVVLPMGQMEKLRRSFDYVRGQPNVSRKVIKDSELRHKIIHVIRNFCKALAISRKEVTTACIGSTECLQLMETIEENFEMRSLEVSTRLRETACVLRGRAMETKGGRYRRRRNFKKKEYLKYSKLYMLASASIGQVPPVLEYVKVLVDQYANVVKGLESWLEDYAKDGQKLVEALKKKRGTADGLRDRYNHYLDEGRVFRQALERFSATVYMLRRELDMVPAMAKSEKNTRKIVDEFLMRLRKKL